MRDEYTMTGEKVPSAKFSAPGDMSEGYVSEKPSEVQQSEYRTDGLPGEPLFWDDGKPRMQTVITLLTEHRDGPDDDGRRRVYAKGELFKAIRDACRTAKIGGLAVGDKLAVTHTSVGGKQGKTKLFTATVTPGDGTVPGAAVPAASDDEPPF
jgi:hypothetical protein